MFSARLYCGAVCVRVHSMAVHLSPGEPLPVLSLSSLPLQEHTTCSDIRSQRSNTQVYIPSVCLRVCLFAHTHLSACPSAHISIKLIKARHLPSFCLSVCLRVCPSICLSSKRSQMIGFFGGDKCVEWVGEGGSHAPFGIAQLKLNRVLNGRNTKWLQQSIAVAAKWRQMGGESQRF